MEEILLLRANGAVFQPFGIVTGKNELHRGKERRDKLRLLVDDALANAVTNGNAAVLQLQHPDGDAVHIQHNVRALFVVAVDRHLLGNGEVILLRLVPVDEFDCFGVFTGSGQHLHPITQQAVHRLVVVIKAATVVVRLGVQLMYGLGDLRRGVATAGQIITEQPLLDIAIAIPVFPVAKIAVIQLIPKQGNHPVLGHAFRFTYTHIRLARSVLYHCWMLQLKT